MKESENYENFNNIPEHYLDAITHYVVGFHNETRDFSEPILKPVVANIYPIFIVQYGLLSLFGIISNSTIIFYIMRYKLYRDVTHAFIVNLAVCHFVQAAIALPITLMVNLIKNFVFGQFLCFFLPLLQVSSIFISYKSIILIYRKYL